MENTPRNIVLQVGSLIALYLSVSFLLTLVFGLVNLAYPIASDSYWEIERAGDSVRMGIAMVIVFFSTYLVLTRLVNRYRRSESGLYQSITRWLVYLSLLVGGLVMLATLVTVIYTFLNGDITTRFILKAGAVLLITGVAFYYYLLDLRGYWVKNELKSIWYGVLAGIVVLTVLVLGFMNIETPTEVREMKIDEQQIYDLRNIQWRIERYLETSTSTPATLVEAYGDADMIPTAPEGREDYTYEVTSKGFKLCATFSRNPNPDIYNTVPYKDPNLRIQYSENWDYKAGRHCFERVVQ
jgi:hypothetical protein